MRLPSLQPVLQWVPRIVCRMGECRRGVGSDSGARKSANVSRVAIHQSLRAAYSFFSMLRPERGMVSSHGGAGANSNLAGEGVKFTLEKK